jgi:uncharacterized protein YggE
MRCTIAFLIATLTASFAFGQSPTITAEATEVIQVKPTRAKIFLCVQVKNTDATTASDESAEQAKQFVTAIDNLKLKKASVVQLPPRASRVSDNENGPVIAVPPGAPAQPQAPKEVESSRPIIVTITDPDFAKLTEAIDLVQKEALKVGLMGEKRSSPFDPFNRGSSSPIKVEYDLTDGWDKLTADALRQATKAATARAEAIANGLGMKLGAVVSAGEVDTVEAAKQTSLISAIYGNGSEPTPTDNLTEGYVTRTIRVRVVFQVAK